VLFRSYGKDERVSDVKLPLTLYDLQIGNVQRHFFDLSVVELFDITHHTDIIVGDKVDSNTLTTETTTTTNSVNVVFTVGRKIVAKK
jgi:hypothetical protein